MLQNVLTPPTLLEMGIFHQLAFYDHCPKLFRRGRANGVKVPVTNVKQFGLSVLESEILVAIDHIGWYGYLWFPVVYREILNFGSNASDEQVHAAFASLIRKAALVMSEEKCGEIPEWKLASGALEEAKETMSLGTDLRTRYGLSDPEGR